MRRTREADGAGSAAGPSLDLILSSRTYRAAARGRILESHWMDEGLSFRAVGFRDPAAPYFFGGAPGVLLSLRREGPDLFLIHPPPLPGLAAEHTPAASTPIIPILGAK
jgi:hypothetical protein